MTLKFSPCVCFAIWLLMVSTGQCAIGGTPPALIKSTHIYKTVGDVKIAADVYRPADAKHRPVLVWIHGGGLIVGGRNQIPKDLFELCTQERYIFVSLDYRLAPEVKLPEIAADLQDALHWLHENGAELFDADTSRIVVSGGSAGGFLTMLSGVIVTPKPSALVAYWGYGEINGEWTRAKSSHHGDPIDREQALSGVGHHVVTNTDEQGETKQRGMYYRYLRQSGGWGPAVTGVDTAQQPEKVDEFCAVKQITADYPPILMVHGTADTDVPYFCSADMARELAKHDVKHELLTIEGAEHGLRDGDPTQVMKAKLRALDFIREHLAVKTSVPAWNARGVGLLPQQGIACLDVAADGTILVGTISPTGQPNVLAFDANCKLISQREAGQRWIGEVAAVSRDKLYALCTMPYGRAEDVPTVFSCGDAVAEVPSQLGQANYPQTVFHYGEHSNHAGTHVARFDEGAVALYGNRLLWLEQPGTRHAAEARIKTPVDAVTVALAVHPCGAVVTGCSMTTSERDGIPQDNLFVFKRNEPNMLWSRPPITSLPLVAELEKGVYGTPTLPDGRREELPQRDVLVTAPLSIAVDSSPELKLIATAEYPGWQRWIRSSATGQEQNYGTRFMPARPTISVYDAAGKVVRHFGSEQFAVPVWVDLKFLPGEKQLLAYPHHWTCRGLAGQTVLPADENVKTLWLLDIETGDVEPFTFQDAVCSVAVDRNGAIAITCWNGTCYLMAPEMSEKNLTGVIHDLKMPALVSAMPTGGFVIAETAGAVRTIDASGKTLATINLNEVIEPTTPTWIANAKAERVVEGLWQLPGGRVESDLGGQRVIEAPDGLILIEGHAGLSFEREWQAIKAAGLDPMRVRYVLATHEHGDHSPGVYLWRVATGAEFICSSEMAYTLQHHIPLCSGYGLHPPIPTDRKISQDEVLDLAGLPVAAVRLPGHTFGSMGWMFTTAENKYVAIGDLIMPDGPLGYAGSINFSATDVLASLRKLDSLRVDFILPGHGPIAGPERYIAAGIGIGRHVGWGKIRPEAPDPRYLLTQENVVVAAWNRDAAAADSGDFNDDGLPDVAVVVPKASGSQIELFLNQGGRFHDEPDHTIDLPRVINPGKLRVRELNGNDRPDFMVGSSQSALVLSKGSFPEFEIVSLPLGEANQVRRCDLEGKGRPEMIACAKFGSFHRVLMNENGSTNTSPLVQKVSGAYPDLLPVDLNGDGREDLVSSYGHVFLRNQAGQLPADPTLKLPPAAEGDWSFLGLGDFNGDGRPDVTLSSYGQGPVRTAIFYNTGDAGRPFTEMPSATLELDALTGEKQIKGPLLRDSLPAADVNGDGIVDLIVAKGQDQRVVVLLGSRDGLNLENSIAFDLDYRLHYETGLFIADFNGDGKLDVGSLGNTKTGVGAGGPLAVYIYLQQ